MPIEIHRRPNESCLEPFRSQIAEQRMLGWPYRKIARWLLDEHQLQVSWVAVRKFCLVRHIEKGIGETEPKTAETKPQKDLYAVPAEPLVKRRQRSSKVFEYVDDGRPLQTRRTRDLSPSDEETGT